MTQAVIDQAIFESMISNEGRSLQEINKGQLVLLVFLRHFGCTFCRQALRDLAGTKEELAGRGVKLVFVHLSTEAVAKSFFQKFKLGDVERISDPETEYYRAFGLTKGTFQQLLGLQNWIRGFQSSIVEGNGGTLIPIGDGFQMPGVFLLRDNEVKMSFVHQYASDRPDYVDLVSCCTEQNEKISA